MSQPVIDRLEPIQIDKQERKVHIAILLLTLHGPTDTLQKLRAIRQSRERIAQGFAARVFLRFSQTPYFCLREADLAQEHQGEAQQGWQDRKSTRLNSSHSQISYAVFCLKKKKKKKKKKDIRKST